MRFAEQWGWCRVEAIRDVTPTIREFLLKPDGGVAASYPVGSHINVSLLIDGQPQTRSYSLVGERRPDAYRIAVRRADDGRGGSLAMWALAPGARLEITAPASLFEIDWTRQHYCLIAGGIGITPMLGIAAALSRKSAPLAMHYAVRSRDDAAFLDEIKALLGDRLTIRASDAGERIDFATLFAELPASAGAIFCGPMRMLEAARHAWAAQGRAPADLRYETFGSSGSMPSVDFRVRLADSGVEITVPQNRSMLAALNDAGYEVMSDCERGECGVCAIDVRSVAGTIDHRDVFFSDHQKAENTKMCPCVSRASGVVTVDTLYRSDRV